ncbi:MAG: heavy-metal-associated domain-containing protein [Candidatus Heimdallarchaeota archaeon]|nr:heavy-metal-associated domain-containing protein [Candidatus Heimdallarchaeota archaeon]
MEKNIKITFKISGMSCNGCAASIGRVVSRLEGVSNAEASFNEGSAVIEFNESQIKKEKIIESIENLGYKVEGEK